MSKLTEKTEEVNYVPGVKSINTKDVVSFFKDPESQKFVYKTLSLSFDRVKKADFVLLTTVEHLEPDVLSALNRYQPNYAIGPINFSKNLPTNVVCSKSLWYESDCASWLESKSPGSVLYVSFESFVHSSKKIIEEVAYGLLLSGVNFIWVIRERILNSGDNANVLPLGIENEVKGQGLIVHWCDQIKVLSSPVVGGFLTHCGWNSTVEIIWYGVPMICYPISYDQPTNRKLVVDDWKIGIVMGFRVVNFMNGKHGEARSEKWSRDVEGNLDKSEMGDGSAVSRVMSENEKTIEIETRGAPTTFDQEKNDSSEA
ncbi:UDP-glycosyltransferase 86A1 [Striga hermonthica]|uniref:UDP-glycosyltransferase 86A1 n=1 Tax=Striga hermonthica TaxID=68872 RepID=A0A9N7NGV9_STRHE|nr:UDP-glycosyltransferase 86A1 [Striga hermonthica]